MLVVRKTVQLVSKFEEKRVENFVEKKVDNWAAMLVEMSEQGRNC